MSVASAVGFVEVLRRSGNPVPLASSQLFIRALDVVGLSDPEGVYWAGRSTLLPRPEDIDSFNSVFAAYWGATTRARGWRPADEPRSVTVGVDDPDRLPDGPDGGSGSDDLVTLRYSRAEVLGQKDFADYTDAELDESRSVMARIALDGAQRRSRRRRPHRGDVGPLDMRHTVREALRTGGEPLRVVRSRAEERPRRLVVLLDVSGSMELYARALIRFVHAAVVGRRKVEAFALGTRLTRLTRELSSRDPDRAVTAAGLAVADWSGGTRLGEALSQFNDEWGCRGMARGAVVVILSDGWDRGEPADMATQMERLHRASHRLIWVNPLRAAPGYQPLARGMAAALPHIDTFLEGHCLDSLEQLAEVILADKPIHPSPVPAGSMADAGGGTR